MRSFGRSIPRREDHRFLVGAGRYVADLHREGTLHAAFVRSDVAAGRIVAVDPAAAIEAPGVVAVFTGAELDADLGPLPQLTTPQQRFAEAFALDWMPPEVACLAVDEVRYVGEPVAVVIAEDRYLAEDAADLVAVDLEPLAPVMSVGDACAAAARPVRPCSPDNVALRLSFAKGAPPTLDDGHVVIERTFTVGRHSGVPIECRGVLAEPVDGGVEVWTSSQVPYLVRRAICGATGWGEDQVRVRAPDVGGGFGPKANVYGEEVVVPVVARRLGRPVQWIEDRYEHLISAAQSRDQVHRTRLVVDQEGRIVDFEDDFTVDLGAHNLWMTGVVANTAIHLLGAYRIPNCRIRGRGVYTNKTPTSQYRGAGRPEATFALERSLDAAARALGISRLKLREVNILRADDLPHPQGIPYRDGVDIVYDGRDYGAVLQACQDLVPEEEVAALRQAEAAAGRRVGVGVATFVEATGRGPYEIARAMLRRDGRVVVAVATASAGMAHETTLAQVAADAAGCRFEDVEVAMADTANVPDGFGSFASRTAVVAGGAVHQAGRALAARGRSAVATWREVSEDEVAVTGEGFRVDGELVSWAALADHLAPAAQTDNGGTERAEAVIEVEERFVPESVTWTMGAHLAVVSVDPTTGLIKVLRYAAADEGGLPINPKVVEGQVRGGIAQGIGGALMEEFRYDGGGQPTSTTFAEYLLPGTGEVPALELAHIDVASELNPIGAKGVGESGTIPGCAVLAAAVEDALDDLGVEVAATPILPMQVRAWVREAQR